MPEPSAELVRTCGSRYRVRSYPLPEAEHPVLGCLLAPHGPEFRHYTADPDRPGRFWTWADADAVTTPPVTTRSSGGVVDLLTALQRSVDAAKADRVTRPGEHQ